MKNVVRIFFVLTILFLSINASAADNKDRGTIQVGAQGTAWFFGEDIDNLVGPSVNVLAFYTEELAVGGRFEAGLGDETVYSILGEVQYAMPKVESVTPYFGALIGPSFVSGDGDSDSALKFGGVLGVKGKSTDSLTLFGEFQMGYISAASGTSYFSLGVGGLFRL